jgi:hypothetical protein
MHVARLDFRKFPGWLVAAALLVGCQSTYYGVMEKLGYEKRDILVDRVHDARDAQQEAKQQFESALAQFIAVTNFSGGELEQQYNKLKGEFEDSESRADAVRKRIADVDRVAQDLFTEWQHELTEYSNPELRRESQRQLTTTRARYRELIGAMRRAEKKLDPVLAAFRDRVLFLKHNLNARAIASLKSERAKMQTDIAALVADMNRSIAEADRFLKDMSADKKLARILTMVEPQPMPSALM